MLPRTAITVGVAALTVLLGMFARLKDWQPGVLPRTAITVGVAAFTVLLVLQLIPQGTSGSVESQDDFSLACSGGGEVLPGSSHVITCDMEEGAAGSWDVSSSGEVELTGTWLGGPNFDGLRTVNVRVNGAGTVTVSASDHYNSDSYPVRFTTVSPATASAARLPTKATLLTATPTPPPAPTPTPVPARTPAPTPTPTPAPLPAPLAPSVSLEPSGPTAMTVVWETPAHVSEYEVQYRKGSTGDWTVAFEGAPAAEDDASGTAGLQDPRVLSGLDCDSTYEVRSRTQGDGVIRASAWSPWSDVVSAKTGPCPQVDPPSSLESTQSSDSFVLSWDSVEGATEYRYRYRKTADSGWEDAENTADTSATITPDGGIDCGTQYEFSVSARGDGQAYSDGWSAWAESESVTALGCAPAPSTVSATYANGSFTMTWGAVTGAADYEYAYRKGDSGPWTKDTVAGTRATIAPFSTSECAVTYRFEVRARGDGASYSTEWGLWSSTASADIGDCPSRMSRPTVAAGTGRLQVTRGAPPAGSAVTGYQVRYKLTSAPDTEPSWTVTSLTAGTASKALTQLRANSYDVQVRACTGAGGLPPCGPWSPSARATPLSSPVVSVARKSGSDVNEGTNVAFTLTAAPAPAADLTVRVSVTTTGSFLGATAQLPTSVTIARGSATADIVLATDDDSTYERHGTVRVEVRSGSGYEVGTSGAVVNVLDNDTPAVSACDTGAAVPNAGLNRELAFDCDALLKAQERLDGTATLNWSVDTAITAWDGITVSGTPGRVTRVQLPSRSLTGSVPPSLGLLSALTHLTLSGNSLSGMLPQEMDGLTSLTFLRLAGNSFTICVPSALRDVANNDLSTLNLNYCDEIPPATGKIAATDNAGAEIGIAWSAVPGADLYRVQRREARSPAGGWIDVVDIASLSTAFTPDDTTLCGTTLEFRVRARGDGTAYLAEWGMPSGPASYTVTEGCMYAPEFPRSRYVFSASTSAAVGTRVGLVTASDQDEGDGVTYYITEGNDTGIFSIDLNFGDIQLAKVPDSGTASLHTLTVEARDNHGLTDTATVVIIVPTTSSYTFSTPENTGTWTSVGVLTAVDREASEAVTFHITAGNGAGVFAIDLNRGDLWLMKELDYETVTSYTLTVETRDVNGLRDTATVTVTVTDVPNY
ncbi:MAG: cadherin domain-containing protein [Chloroflexi bacterium]|nr:cadherin domain-containing protein [Chloroflexota bacterium]